MGKQTWGGLSDIGCQGLGHRAVEGIRAQGSPLKEGSGGHKETTASLFALVSQTPDLQG